MIIDYLSASRADLFFSCPFKYFLKYHLDLDELNQEAIAASKGSAVHFALEHYIKNPNRDKGLCFERLVDYYASSQLWYLDDRKPGKGWKHPVKKDCANCKWATPTKIDGVFDCKIAKTTTDSFDGCPAPNFDDDWKITQEAIARNSDIFSRKIIGTEVPFDITLGELRIHGFMDLVTEISSDMIEVRDYKSGNYAKDTEDANIDIQMRMYSLAAKYVFPEYKYVVMTLDYLRKAPVSVIFGPEDDAKTLDYIADLYSRIQNSVDPPRIKSFKCSWCVGYDKCGKMRESFIGENGKFIMPPPAQKKNRQRKLPTIEE